MLDPAHFVIGSDDVHACVGSDRVRDPRRVAAGISELDADVVGPQEVDSRSPGSDGPCRLAVRMREAGFVWTDGPTMQRADGRDLAVLPGDFNEWWVAGRLLRRLHRAPGRTRGVRSFPARAPLSPVDRICVKPARVVREIRAHRSALARRASDHLPVTARIEISPRSSPTQRTS